MFDSIYIALHLNNKLIYGVFLIDNYQKMRWIILENSSTLWEHALNEQTISLI